MAHDQPAGNPRSFARLGNRISAWTTKALLSAIVLVAGLGFGRQVLRWWASGSPESSEASLRPENEPLGDPRQFHLLEFGNQPWSVGRQWVTGDKKTAICALRARCRELIASDTPPGSALPVQPELLADLARRRPVDEAPGRWKLYELSDDLPMVLGTRAGGEQDKTRACQRLAEPAPHVVIWGLGVPAASGTWTIYTFQPSDGRPLAAPMDIPFPPGGSRILSARAVDGVSITAFAGSQSPETWRGFYDEWFAVQGWTAVDGWRQSGSAWHARYMGETGGKAVSVEIEFGDDQRGALRGVLIVTPVAPAAWEPGQEPNKASQ